MARAQTVEIKDRVIADYGRTGDEPGGDVWEPALATTAKRRLAVVCRGLPTRILRAATASNQSASWRADDIEGQGTTFTGDDPSIIVTNPELDEFVVFSRVPEQLKYCTFTPSTGFGAWTTAATGDPGFTGIDKSWAIRRTQNDYFVFWSQDSAYRFLRSSTGTTWGGTPTIVTADFPIPASFFCSQPAVAADQSLLLAHATGNYGPPEEGRIRILVGTVTSTSVTWLYMSTGAEPLELTPRHPQGNGLPIPPLPTGLDFISKTVPQIVGDPTDETRAFMVFHDTAADDPEDMNIYFVRLQKLTTGMWSVDRYATVHSDVSSYGVRADQFCPTVTVDLQGRIHVTYYDNRPAFGSAGFGLEFDVYHAFSSDHGDSFTCRNLRTSGQQDPAMNLGLLGTGLDDNWSPHEYNGIAIDESSGVLRGWLVYAGTCSDDPDAGHQSVIYGQHYTITEE